MTAVVARPASPTDVIRLQYGNPHRMIGVPLYILGGVVVVTVAITAIVLRSGGSLDGSDSNGSVLWSILGYTVVIGVQNVATSFPLALALGSTRRTFVLGNLLTSLAQGLLVSAAAVVLLLLETATGGWFIGARALSASLLGGGNPLVLAGVILLAQLTSLTVGGLFGSAWVRFGARGPLVLSLLIVLVVILLLFLLPAAPAIAAAFAPWWIPAGASAVIAVGVIGQYLLLRRASVR